MVLDSVLWTSKQEWRQPKTDPLPALLGGNDGHAQMESPDTQTLKVLLAVFRQTMPILIWLRAQLVA